MGSGKTSIGRKLAKVIHAEFFDIDQEIEKRTGATVPLVFEIEGEPGFRQRESELLDELTKYSDIVLATGGGAVLDSYNRKLLAERGLVIYLKAGINHLLKRTGRDRKRPLLNCDNPREKMEQLLAERGPLYEEVADMVIDTDKHSMKKVVEIITHYRTEQCNASR